MIAAGPNSSWAFSSSAASLISPYRSVFFILYQQWYAVNKGITHLHPSLLPSHPSSSLTFLPPA